MERGRSGFLARLPPSWPVGAAATAVAASLLVKTVADPDLWGHLAFGRLVMAAGLPRDDPFSYTATGAPWTDHEWLSEVVMYLTFRATGPLGLVALKVALLGVMLGIVVSAMREAGGGIRAAGVVAVLLIAGGLASFVTVRPQLFTFPLFAAFLIAITRADAGRPRLLWLTPMLTLAWSNLHGGVAAGLAVLALWGTLRLAQAGARSLGLSVPAPLRIGAPDPRRAAAIALVLALQVPAATLTPYGVDLWRYLGETVGTHISDVTEWRPATPADFGDALGIAAVAALAATLLVRRHPRDQVYLLILGALVAAGLSVRRYLPLALIAAAILAAPQIAHVLRERTRRQPPSRPLAVTVTSLAVAVLAFGLPRGRCVQILPGTVPRATVAYLEAASVSGNLAVFYDWGAYAIWHLGPRLRVSIDGRRETLYPPDVLRANLAFLDALPGWRHMLDDHETDLALLSPRFAVYERLAAEPDWRLALTDGVSGLFVRRGTGADLALERTPPPAIESETSACLGRSG